jgi:TatD DNase family protein
LIHKRLFEMIKKEEIPCIPYPGLRTLCSHLKRLHRQIAGEGQKETGKGNWISERGRWYTMMTLVDTHAHLEELEDLSGALARAAESGVDTIVAVGMDLPSNRRTMEISGRYGGTTVHPALGIHPWNLESSQVDTTLGFIEENIEKAVAVGEIGLDYWLKRARKDPKERDSQKEVFRALLELAKRYGKPAIIHARGSWEDCYRLAAEVKVQRAVFHWYSGPVELLDELFGRDYYISATPAAEYSKKHQTAILRAPLNNLLLETDCPVKYQRMTSEPAHVRKTLEAVARLKGIEKDKIAELTTRNALKFFGLESNRPSAN